MIHLVDGFHVAGFPHVVGCLSQSDDTTCVTVTEKFYSKLLEGGMDWDDRAVASALREAVLAAREEDLHMPSFWAQFVHYEA